MDVEYVPDLQSADGFSPSSGSGGGVLSVTADERLALTPSGFQLVYDTDFRSLMYWDGTAWRVKPGFSAFYAGVGGYVFTSTHFQFTSELGLEISPKLAACLSFYSSETHVGLEGVFDYSGIAGTIDTLTFNSIASDLHVDRTTIDNLEVFNPNGLDFSQSKFTARNANVHHLKFQEDLGSYGQRIIDELAPTLVWFTLFNSDIATLDFSLSTQLATVEIDSCSNLSSFTSPTAGFALDGSDYCQVVITACALDQASVDAIIMACPLEGFVIGFLDIRGGTSASPSGDAITRASDLVTAGWTVLTN